MLRKLITYFLTINGGVAITVALGTFSNLSTSKEVKKVKILDDLQSFVMVIKKKEEVSESTNKEKTDVNSDEKNLLSWENFEKSFILFQKSSGIWRLQLFQKKEDYKKWFEDTKEKTTIKNKKEADNSQLVHVLFPLKKGEKIPEFLGQFSAHDDYSKYDLSGKLKNIEDKFKSEFGEENYKNLTKFFDNFENPKRN